MELSNQQSGLRQGCSHETCVCGEKLQDTRLGFGESKDERTRGQGISPVLRLVDTR